MSQKRFIFVTGGVLSSLGKGVAAASIGTLLESHGLKVGFMKLDPYINVDPGTMSPYQHGEVFVTNDGAETDLDLGHYERFTDAELTRHSSVTTGQIYQTVINNERKGDYLGKTVQVIPHITDEIKKRVRKIAEGVDAAIIEVGGTVGDIESLPFLEALRQLRNELGQRSILFVHLTYVPFIAVAGELKTKPTQHSTRELREIGIMPDILICRTDRELTRETREKISLFCNVPLKSVIEGRDVRSVYDIPLMYKNQGLDRIIMNHLEISGRPDQKLRPWCITAGKLSKQVQIAIVGKYLGGNNGDTYKSIIEALKHAGMALDAGIEIDFVSSEEFEHPKRSEEKIKARLSESGGVLIPGGFGERGIEGMINVVRYVRSSNIPFFGICLGMQVAVIEYARNMCGFDSAHSTEFDPETPYPVIAKLSEFESDDMGGTMRLGAYQCVLEFNSLARSAYGVREISERHRHRFELNGRYEVDLNVSGMIVTGRYKAEKYSLAEIVEVPEHPWFLACQFHPEFKSKPHKPHPLFVGFIRSILRISE